MRTIKLIAMSFLVIGAFACNNNQRKKAEDNSSSLRKSKSDKVIDNRKSEPEQEEYKTCDSLVKEILTTSPRYEKFTKGLHQAVVKNGGLSFGIRLESSPNSALDQFRSYSNTYDFIVYEVYADRELNTARFSFDPNSNQLFEYDEVNDQLKPIEFNKKLLPKFEALCK